MSRPLFRNTPERFGLVSRLLHWLTAAAVFFLLGLGMYVARMQVNLSNLWLFGLHKTVGITVLALTAARIALHVASPPPHPLPDAAWRNRLARAVHRAMLLLLVLIPVAGWAASSATGLEVVVFGRWTLPPIAPVSEAWEDALFRLHGVLGGALAALVMLHIAGAVTRRDGTVRRMVRGDR